MTKRLTKKWVSDTREETYCGLLPQLEEALKNAEPRDFPFTYKFRVPNAHDDSYSKGIDAWLSRLASDLDLMGWVVQLGDNRSITLALSKSDMFRAANKSSPIAPRELVAEWVWKYIGEDLYEQMARCPEGFDLCLTFTADDPGWILAEFADHVFDVPIKTEKISRYQVLIAKCP